MTAAYLQPMRLMTPSYPTISAPVAANVQSGLMQTATMQQVSTLEAAPPQVYTPTLGVRSDGTVAPVGPTVATTMTDPGAGVSTVDPLARNVGMARTQDMPPLMTPLGPAPLPEGSDLPGIVDVPQGAQITAVGGARWPWGWIALGAVGVALTGFGLYRLTR